MIENLLKSSLFYYCCGKDITPICAFKNQYPLYVYADKLSTSRPLDSTLEELYSRLKKQGFDMDGNHEPVNYDFCVSAYLSKWKQGFYLLYLQGDAVNVYKGLYVNTMPKCIANCYYELGSRSHFLRPYESKVSYILGHCFYPSFEKIASYDYLGDYKKSPDEKVFLFKNGSILWFTKILMI